MSNSMMKFDFQVQQDKKRIKSLEESIKTCELAIKSLADEKMLCQIAVQLPVPDDYLSSYRVDVNPNEEEVAVLRTILFRKLHELKSEYEAILKRYDILEERSRIESDIVE